jgi:16S rRNA (guanine(966)-N(2))-methyltransferase RsmD
MFNMLDAMGADYSHVLDLYAGTGALGIEALSRGDGDAVFVERDRDAVDVIRANLAACRFEDRATVLSLTTARAAHHLRDSPPFTLILADPPYYDEDALKDVQDTVSRISGPATALAFEHHRRSQPPQSIGPLPLYKSRRHGDTVVSIYTAMDEEDA